MTKLFKWWKTGENKPLRSDESQIKKLFNYNNYSVITQPINNGRCCSVCNIEVVIPTRIKLFQAQLDYKPKKKEEE